MTLGELIEKATRTAAPFSSAWIPLKVDGHHVDIDFEAEGSNEDGYVINMKIKQKL